MVSLHEIPNGLLIKIEDANEFSEFLTDSKHVDERHFLHDLLDSARYIGNDWHCPTDIGLTEAPAIGYGAIHGDDSESVDEIVDYDSLWIFNNYMVESFSEKLLNEGFVIFNKVLS